MSERDRELADLDNARVLRLDGWVTMTPARKAYLESPEGQAEMARADEIWRAVLAEKEAAARVRAEKERIERNRKARERRKARK